MNIPLSSNKTSVAILFGGKSAEHEVSLQSAQNVLDAIDATAYSVTLLAIDKKGVWYSVDESIWQRSSFEDGSKTTFTPANFLPGRGTALISAVSGEQLVAIDVVFPILHGPLGEDGTVQGLLDLAGIPYVGPAVLGSALGMDKEVVKRLLRDAGIPIAPYRVFSYFEHADIEPQELFDALGTPVFVKPANMGSSVGVSRADTVAQLRTAIDTAFCFDTKILVEAAVSGDEIECAILGNDNPKASVLGKIVPRTGDFYSYEAKYIDESGAILEIPAQLPADVAKKAQDIALRVFDILQCEGLSRVDMFLKDSGDIVVNEINTIPGFTKISMYPKLWEATGLTYTQLITTLLELALERSRHRATLQTSYTTN